MFSLEFVKIVTGRIRTTQNARQGEWIMVAGHLREQNGYYQMILNWKGKDGKRKSKSISTKLQITGNKQRAEEMLMLVRQNFNPDNEPENADMLFAEFIEKWMYDKKIVIPPALYTQYAYSLSAVIQPYFLTNRISLSNLNALDLEKFYCCAQNDNHAGAQQLMQYHALFTSALDYAMELRWIRNNPASEVNPCAYEAVLFTDFLVDWLDVIRCKIAPTTYSSYVMNIERSIIPYFEPKRLTLKQLEFQPQHIQEYYQHLLSNGLSPTTVIRRHANIHNCLQYAFRLGLIKSNPADRIEKPRMDKYQADIYNKDELEQLLIAAKGDPLELPILAAAFYGLRRSEVLGLRWDAIDFERKTIRINHTVVQTIVNGETKTIRRDSTKTESSYRTLPLVLPFENLLLELRKEQARNRKSCGAAYCTDYLAYICVNQTGQLLKPNFVTQHFALLLERNGLKKIRFHDLRHSCASLLYANGIGIKEIQEWLGHSDIGTTSNIYTHLDYNTKSAPANALVKVFSSFC